MWSSPTTTHRKILLTLFLCIAVVPMLFAQTDRNGAESSDPAPTEEELFEQAFGEEAEASSDPAELPLALYIGSRYLGEINARIQSGGGVQIEIRKFLETMKNYVKPNIYNTLRKLSEEEFVSTTAIEDTGITAAYRPDELRLLVEIPPMQRRPRQISMISDDRSFRSLSPSASTFSAYLNAYGDTNLIYSRFEEGSKTDFPLFFTVEPNLQFSTWVLENRTTYSSETDPAVELDYVRAVKDFPQPRLRLTAGILPAPTADFLGSFSMLGASLGTHNALKQAYGGTEGFSPEIVIEESAELLVYMNGRLIKRARVEPGPLELLDFPFVSGLNNLRVELQREDATTELLQQSIPFDSKLLAPGEYSFSAGAGTFREDLSRPAASGHFSYGLGRTTTAGVFLQSDAETHIGGPEFLQSTRTGTFSALAGFSYDDSSTLGYAGRFRYRLAFPSNPYLPTFAASLLYTDSDFVTGIEGAHENRYPWQFSAQISQSLPLEFNLTLIAGHRTGEKDVSDLSSGSLTILKSMGETTSLSLSAGIEVKSDGTTNWNGSLYVTIHPEESGKTVIYGQDVKTGTGEVTYSAASNGGASDGGGDSSYSLSLRGYPPSSADYTTVTGSYRYSHDKFRTSLNNYYSTANSGGTSINNRASLNFSSALLFAEGKFGISHPVSDSFLIVAPEGKLEEEVLSVNTAAGGGTKKESRGKPIIIGDIRSYNPVSLHFDTPTSPPQTVLTTEDFTLLPSYKSGSVIRTSIEETISVNGSLLTLNGNPIPMQAGQVLSSGEGKGREEKLFFTNEDGSFQLHDLEPGEYDLRLFSEDIARTTIEVPEDAESPHEIGEIILPVVLEKNRLEAE